MKALTRMRLPLGILALALIATIAITFVLSTHAISHAASSPNKGSRTYTYKTHVTGDADSGTCGINWATDSFDRNFSINTSNTSIFQVVFKNGSSSLRLVLAQTPVQIMAPAMATRLALA